MQTIRALHQQMQQDASERIEAALALLQNKSPLLRARLEDLAMLNQALAAEQRRLQEEIRQIQNQKP